jgi:hypothetical protein
MWTSPLLRLTRRCSRAGTGHMRTGRTFLIRLELSAGSNTNVPFEHPYAMQCSTT